MVSLLVKLRWHTDHADAVANTQVPPEFFPLRHPTILLRTKCEFEPASAGFVALGARL